MPFVIQGLTSGIEYLSITAGRHPVFAPFRTPAYSNAAHDILGIVIESLMNTTYDIAGQKQISEPLNMTHSSVSPPKSNSVRIIPVGNDYWSWDFGASNP